MVAASGLRKHSGWQVPAAARLVHPAVRGRHAVVQPHSSLLLSVWDRESSFPLPAAFALRGHKERYRGHLKGEPGNRRRGAPRERALRRAGDDSLDQGKLRGPRRSRAEADAADFGQEPPLSVDGGTPGFVDRRRVSVQWFSGTVLTGLCGAALMGGAVYAALDGETTFGAVPERIEAALRGTLAGISERFGAATRKTDKLPSASEISAARQVIRVSTMARAGDREVVRVRPFIRVASNLSLSTSELSANIPPFNPQKLLADAVPHGPAGADAAPDTEPDAEVSFVTRDLAAMLPKAKIAAVLPLEEIVAKVRDVAEWATGSVRAPVNAGLQPGTKLAYAAEGNLDPYVGFEA